MKIEIEKGNEQESVKKIQGAIDELLSVIKEQERELKNTVKVMADAEEQIKNLTTTAVGFADTIKATHLILQNRKEMFAHDTSMMELLKTLSTFVVSSSAIKLGVISHAREKGEE